MTKRADINQAEIAAALRSAGATVQDLHAIGHGCPDLLVAIRGVNLLVEVKSAKGKLTRKEANWHAAWRGQVVIVRSVDQALALLECTCAKLAHAV